VSESLHHRLNAYVLAASAAGVSVLALTMPAEAKIVYTATHKIITGPVNSYNLDLNHDGITDFILTESYSCDSGCAYDLGGFGARSNNGIAVGARYRARALRSGARIGPKQHFLSGNRQLVSIFLDGTYRRSGYWINVSNRYLGLQFKIKGETHYGWARLSVEVQRPLTITATLTGYAYETIPNKPIIAGKTHGKEDATLGRLAQGPSGLSAWRQKH